MSLSQIRMSTMSTKKGTLDAVVLTKRKIRSKILAAFKLQKEEDRERKSKAIQVKLFRTQVFKKAKIVMFYIAFRGEVNTQKMIKEAQNLGKIIAVPVCTAKRVFLKPCVFKLKAKLRKGPYGVCEPATKKSIKLKDLDLVIVPGLAFDQKGNRLGRGKGCYDRFLGKLSSRVETIGLAFDFQILPNIPTNEADVKVRRVVFA